MESLASEDAQHVVKCAFPWKAQQCQEAGISLIGHDAVLFHTNYFQLLFAWLI